MKGYGDKHRIKYLVKARQVTKESALYVDIINQLLKQTFKRIKTAEAAK